MSKKTHFENVLDYLETQKIFPSQIVKTLDNDVSIKIDSAKISHYKYGDQTPSSEVIDAMHKHYHINPDYLKETSDVMLDHAGIILEQYNSLFPKWSTTSKTYIDSEGRKITDTYLHFTMREADYNFLKEVDSSKFLKEQGMKSFNEELEKCKAECNNSEDNYCEYVLIPRNCFIEILTAEERDRKLLDELIDPSKHNHYLDADEH